jgi:hypothetical protein
MIEVPTATLPAVLNAIENAHSARSIANPSDSYIMGRQDWPPERRYQLSFHKSDAIIRALFPGNGAGKTTVAGIEADFWLQHRHPFQKIQKIPPWNIQVLWVCQSFPQIDMLRKQLEEFCLSPGWTYNETKHRYVWGHGGSLSIFSDDGDWKSLQGVPIDLCIVDEECDPKHWRELVMRRRGRKLTRYVISATATQGKRWMYHEVYLPWLQYHQNLGWDEDAAMLAQKHPQIWCWPKGGLRDNPLSANDQDGIHWYDSVLARATPQERKVRMEGGFASLNAAPVFDLENLEVMQREALPYAAKGQIGLLVPSANPKKHLLAPQTATGLEVANPMIADFDFLPNGQLFQGGAITIYELPELGESYVMGADFGEGLENRDWDAAVVLAQRTKRQVAQARGRWGDVNFAYVLWALGWFFNEALLVGERQFGLPIMRRLYDEWGYVYQYMAAEDEKRASVRKSDLLGHHRYYGDLVIPRLQWAIAPLATDANNRPTGQKHKHEIQFVDPVLLKELETYEWRPKGKNLDMADAGGRQMSMGAPSGLFDDCVMAAAYAVMGWIELPRFVAKKAPILPGSMADVLGHKKVLEAKEQRKQRGPYLFALGQKQPLDPKRPAWPI